MNLPFEIDLTEKVIVITGAGGVLCSMFAKALAKTGAKIALLDLNENAAKEYAAEIERDGGIAKGYACNVLDKASLEAVHTRVLSDLGTCDILINGAGGNNPTGSTSKEYYEMGDEAKVHHAFAVLSDGGVVLEPIHALPWSKCCATIIDKYGVCWWISI